MGDVCTRACRFCAVNTGNPKGWLDPEEPANTARSVQLMGLKYVVLTSVNRDDLADGGAGHYADCVRRVKEENPGTAVEALTPDFLGVLADVETVVDSGIEVFAQNVETVRRLTHPVRDPRASLGDLRAQIAGCRTGERRLAELYARHGTAAAAALAGACLDYAEAYVTRRIADLPDGRREAEVLLEDEVTGDEPLRIHAAIEIHGERLTVDLSGTSAQADNALNNPYASTLSMVHYALKCLLAPEIAQNEGCNRPVEVVVPEGSLLNPRRPAAVSVRHLTQQRLADTVLKALSPLVPDRAAAGCQVAFPTVGAGGFDDRPEMAVEDGGAPYYIISDILGGGMGGSPAGDGLSAVDTHGGNCAILSAEIMETLSPFRVLSSALVPGSGGAGRWRGGLAIRRDYQLLAEKCILGAYVQQNHDWSAPWGLEGGRDGGPAGFWLNPEAPDGRPLPGKLYGLALKRGDVLRMQAAGGGGWGDPAERDPALAERDREEGLA